MVFVRNDCKVSLNRKCCNLWYCVTIICVCLQVFRFCRSKCKRAFTKKKNPRKTGWTKAFRKSAGKDLAVDPSFEFEKRRHVPVKYDRDLWQKSVEAMKKVTEIRCRRQAQHINDRHKKSIEVQRRNDAYEITKNMGLIRSPAAGLQQLAASFQTDKEMSLVPSKVRQLEARVVEEVHDSDREMDLE